MKRFGWRFGIAALLTLTASAPVVAAAETRAESAAPAAGGRPKVVIDRIELPEVADAAHYARHLKQVLRREARRAEWGAGRGSRIELRYEVTELRVEQQGNVVRVRCKAVGRLPGQRSARSSLSYGGDPAKRRRVVERVLEIVARGVITRLAEMERIRRGQLESARVRAPHTE